MSRHSPRTLLTAVALLAAGACTTQTVADSASGSAMSGATDSTMIVEVKAFMDGYAKDLLAGNRVGIGERYDRQGAWMVGNGLAAKQSYDSITARYAGPSWQPPASFTWKDLAYEPQGVNAVLVVGRFAWGMAAGSEPLVASYSALLQRQDGQWRIHLEDESADPIVMAKLLASMDTTAAKPKQK